ncbi:Pfs, NACHT and ankyrin domain protein [Aureobasidium sp. EXF-3400]|nr:Pfs, NACHT and ankyrin domain protein [Aureobasidium sp. EXF-12344]KAI4775977.1 Pfs, NACHT and ankyrin domain protein [Aureobasidium sp. EXF-3400]
MNKFKSLERGELYTVGWIAALAKELTAALAMLDERHGRPDDFEKPSSDKNSYHWGRIGDHNIVIASLAAGVYGTTSAATTAIHMLSSFPNIKVGLMVGIGAGIARPKQKRDIRLGDIVVSLPQGQSGGVLQYDLGRSRVSVGQGHTAHTFERVGFLNSPPEAVLKALTSLRARARLEGSKVSAFLEDMLERYPQMAENEPGEPGYVYQGQDNDRLFEASSIHTSDVGCDDCDSTKIITRAARRDPGVPRVHYGVIASGNKLVKDAAERDLILKESGEDCICLEMEAAGLMNSFPCLIVRGICDYADSHKNDDWQEYAAATAAAYVKEYLGFVDNQDLTHTKRAIEVLQNMSEYINEMATNVKDTGEAVQELRLDHYKSEIRDWLSAADPSINQANAQEKRHEGTGAWFTEGQAFSDWKKQSNSFLWLHGIPGCGKTVLSSNIIERLSSATTPAQVVLYFYFDFNDANKQTLESMLRSLVSQLYQTQPATRGSLEQSWESHKKGQRQLSRTSLMDVLAIMLSKVKELSIVLDALDESTTRSDLLAWLWEVHKNRSLACRILVTSRREQDIDSALRCWMRSKDRIKIRKADVNRDVRAYVHHTVRHGTGLNRWQKMPEVQDEIETELEKKADGMWALRNLPKTLHETYAQIIESIPAEQLAQAATILNLLIWSEWKFNINELVDAIATNLDEDPAFDPRNRMPVPRDVLTLCSSLVAVSQDRKGTEIIQLAHSSVKEYLVSDHVPSAFRPLIEEAVARSYLARLCLRHLIGASRITSQDELLSKAGRHRFYLAFPFAPYSARCWMHHVRDAEPEDESLSNMVLSFFLEEQEAFSLFGKIYGSGDTEGESPLYYATRGGLKRTMENLLNLGEDINALNSSALRAALENGQAKTIQLLFDRGADVNTRNDDILEAAMVPRHDTSVRLLLKRGTLERPGYNFLLMRAVECGRDTTVKLLLENGADPHGMNGQALHAASQDGYNSILQLLLDHHADVNAGDGQALHAATKNGHNTTIQLLLDHGADVNIRDCWALRAVIAHGKKSTIQLLLRSGANVNAGHGRMLREASNQGHARVVQMLLDKGANPNAHPQSALTALQEALVRGYAKLVMSLGEGRSRETALDSNEVSRYYRISRLLVHKGADMNVPGGAWFDTLRVGVWDIQTVQRILERNKFLSADHLLSAMLDTGPQSERIVSAMLPYLTHEAAAAECGRKRNLLHKAAFSGSEVVTRRCLKLGVNVLARDLEGRTALHYAACSGYITIVEILVWAGAGIHMLDNDDMSPLDFAVGCAPKPLIPSRWDESEQRVSHYDVIKYLSD